MISYKKEVEQMHKVFFYLGCFFVLGAAVLASRLGGPDAGMLALTAGGAIGSFAAAIVFGNR
ncbi:hypothetical protein A3I28_01675 [Candidatus Giovannonibacteria bacterium RIFCSPLOWO2_02_FULL_43_37]|uniref:Uncharacterized protein n=1 Tax=Candidatus Giovannonibacteria bacterium RIFCSPLOWO2_12_FULL_43_26 TaxID=1798363 RepID=A0A1F5XVX9_9BACT|nr:MAG: hypothetical protein A3I28_01675 [Candidatus Giovannonibacteria bacterium RIFCSPLOWO2_02_FULL_43_37]OGF92000.1 MAG: hypothetical protein A3H05_03150 [Candidatus Giovannonibacteria bacterium RIFCSPLOWO2_12_FULL_43_26]